MEEKKLNDEEVLRVLEECFAKVGKMKCKECKIHNGEGLRDCMKNVGTSLLDLIHRLQGENKRLIESNKVMEHNMGFYRDRALKAEGKTKRIGAYKVLSDATLKSETKADLIERIRILEHNWSATEASLDIQAKNCEMLLKQKEKDTAKEIIQWIKLNGTLQYGGYVIHDSTIEQMCKTYGIEVE